MDGGYGGHGKWDEQNNERNPAHGTNKNDQGQDNNDQGQDNNDQGQDNNDQGQDNNDQGQDNNDQGQDNNRQRRSMPSPRGMFRSSHPRPRHSMRQNSSSMYGQEMLYCIDGRTGRPVIIDLSNSTMSSTSDMSSTTPMST
ncbi:hypothetical protein RDWZM_009739 [Blomia tropicalis]|uniref:Uncharacterized protein n=1 Tax=Blomia tropicalis TaxID=40697 RepID=A0A9Q0M6V2_BLOTA|nr:hypothetical protein RDWZM_009739 [Blomia tropicalis]